MHDFRIRSRTHSTKAAIQPAWQSPIGRGKPRSPHQHWEVSGSTRDRSPRHWNWLESGQHIFCALAWGSLGLGTQPVVLRHPFLAFFIQIPFDHCRETGCDETNRFTPAGLPAGVPHKQQANACFLSARTTANSMALWEDHYSSSSGASNGSTVEFVSSTSRTPWTLFSTRCNSVVNLSGRSSSSVSTTTLR